MIAAAVPPRRCHSCQTTWPSCMDKREYQSLPCCTDCDHDVDHHDHDDVDHPPTKGKPCR